MVNYLSTPTGFHRLYKAPLDDMEIFNNTKDLMEHCKNGNSYDGQRVAVKFNGFIQHYRMRNSVPLLELHGQELVFKTISGSKYVMVYYHNTSDVYSSNNNYTNFDNIYKFIMMDTLDIFKESNGFTFYLERTPVGSGSPTTATWTQTEHPLNDEISISPSSGATITKLRKAKSTTSGYLEVNNSNIILMPRINDSSYITKIYVKANTYFNAEVNTNGL